MTKKKQMPDKNIDVSVVIVSFNTKKLTAECIESVHKHTQAVSFEIVVVDNASSDGSTEMLQRLASQNKIKFIASPKNRGFGAANNLGAQNAQGRYLLFLNSDTYLEQDTISASIDYLGDHPSIIAYSCRLVSPDGATQPTGGFFPSLSRVLAWQLFLDDLPLFSSFLKPIHPKLSFYSKIRSLDWVTGAFSLIPKKLFDQVGGFDEAIFMYTEELELCYRLKAKGDIIYNPQDYVVHIGGASSGSVNSLVWEAKNLIYFFQKHKPAWQVVPVKQVLRLGSLLRLFIFGIIAANATKAQAYRQLLRELA